MKQDGWNLKKTYTTIVAGVRDAEIYTKAQIEIIETVREAGGSDVGGPGWTTWVGTQSTEFLERFYKLAAAKEREACANICQDLINRIKPIYCVSTENAMKLIRARGQHD